MNLVLPVEFFFALCESSVRNVDGLAIPEVALMIVLQPPGRRDWIAESWVITAGVSNALGLGTAGSDACKSGEITAAIS